MQCGRASGSETGGSRASCTGSETVPWHPRLGLFTRYALERLQADGHVEHRDVFELRDGHVSDVGIAVEVHPSRMATHSVGGTKFRDPSLVAMDGFGTLPTYRPRAGLTVHACRRPG